MKFIIHFVKDADEQSSGFGEDLKIQRLQKFMKEMDDVLVSLRHGTNRPRFSFDWDGFCVEQRDVEFVREKLQSSGLAAG